MFPKPHDIPKPLSIPESFGVDKTKKDEPKEPLIGDILCEFGHGISDLHLGFYTSHQASFKPIPGGFNIFSETKHNNFIPSKYQGKRIIKFEYIDYKGWYRLMTDDGQITCITKEEFLKSRSNEFPTQDI